MIDDDKRRETARRLRAAAEQADPAIGVSELEIFCILDVDMGGERGFANRQDVLRLADLIDRAAKAASSCAAAEHLGFANDFRRQFPWELENDKIREQGDRRIQDAGPARLLCNRHLPFT